MIKIAITIDKSFADEIVQFGKTYEKGDLLEFMKIEGEYLDKLVAITKENGKAGDSFTVSFDIEVEVV